MIHRAFKIRISISRFGIILSLAPTIDVALSSYVYMRTPYTRFFNIVTMLMTATITPQQQKTIAIRRINGKDGGEIRRIVDSASADQCKRIVTIRLYINTKTPIRTLQIFLIARELANVLPADKL